MSKIIAGIFAKKDDAQRAAREIEREGLKIDDISIMSIADETSESNDNVTNGLYSGAAIGGVAGLALGLGTIAVPGLGMIAAAGPIAGMISGALSGGVVGTLVDLGIPEYDSQQYEQEIKNGNVYFSMPITDETGGRVSQILKNCNAKNVMLYK